VIFINCNIDIIKNGATRNRFLEDKSIYLVHTDASIYKLEWML